jgi:glucan phosphoethanolaminetransferase (alkaline phosphatase superfamily)
MGEVVQFHDPESILLLIMVDIGAGATAVTVVSAAIFETATLPIRTVRSIRIIILWTLLFVSLILLIVILFLRYEEAINSTLFQCIFLIFLIGECECCTLA